MKFIFYYHEKTLCLIGLRRKLFHAGILSVVTCCVETRIPGNGELVKFTVFE